MRRCRYNSGQAVISLLRGKVAEKQAGNVVVDVGGVGYEVSVPVETYARLGDLGADASLHVYTHVRENALALFGFDARRDKDLFIRFLDVSGVGPRLALAMLSALTASELVSAIRGGEYKPLVRVPGVGKKTAQRIVLELKEKLESFGDDGDVVDEGVRTLEEDVISALTNLGCTPQAARRGVQAAWRKGAPAEFEALFRLAMASIKR